MNRVVWVPAPTPAPCCPGRRQQAGRGVGGLCPHRQQGRAACAGLRVACWGRPRRVVPESCLSHHTPRASQVVRQLTGTGGGVGWGGVLEVGPQFRLPVLRAGPHLGFGMADDKGLGGGQDQPGVTATGGKHGF